MCESSAYEAVRHISQENGLAVVQGNKGEPRTETLDRYRKRNKTKIPAQVRNNLENALVGLCDVWFEEIKPHLLRHNIKVHCQREIDGMDEDADTKPTAAPAAAGAPRRCSHSHPLLNRMLEGEKCSVPEVYSMHSESPGSSSCEMCRLLLDAAAGIERAASQAAGAAGGGVSAAAGAAVYRHTAHAVVAALPITTHTF